MNFVDTLRAEVPACQVLTEPADTAPYLHDWRGLFHGAALCVARPAHVDEVSALLRIAARHAVGVVAQGGNTGLAGGATPTGGTPQVLLSLGRMQKIRSIDRVGMTMEVEAGCVLETAKEAARAHGRLLPIGFAAQGSAMVGGVIATNAGGINALRYGTTRHMVLGIEAVLADGSVIRKLHGLRKDNTGYDWKQLLIGSEGTLGIVTAAVVRLSALPREHCVAFAAVASPAAAVRLLERLQDTMGDSLSAFELMSGAAVGRAVRFIGGRLPVAPADWHLLIEVGDSAPAPADRLLAALEAAMEEGEIEDAAVADSLSRAQEFWALRENITEAERHAGASVKHDVAVSVSQVPAFIEAASAAIAALSPVLRQRLRPPRRRQHPLQRDPGSARRLRRSCQPRGARYRGTLRRFHRRGTRHRAVPHRGTRAPQAGGRTGPDATNQAGARSARPAQSRQGAADALIGAANRCCPLPPHTGPRSNPRTTMHRRRLLTATMAAAASSCASFGLHAQAAVTKLLVGATPGGGTDIVARALAREMAERLGRNYVVENRPGAAGNIAALAVARAAPDGNTLLLSYTSHAINASLYPTLPFDPIKDFTPLCGVASLPAILVGKTSLKANNIAELIALAKAKPGSLNLAIAGLGSANHLAGEMLKRDAGIDIVSVPYKGTSPALADVVAGQIDLAFSGVASVQTLIKGGLVKPLAVTSAQRLPAFPNVPTIGELLPGYAYSSWYGLFGPARMAPALVEQLSSAALAGLESEAVRSRFKDEGLVPMGTGPQDFDRFVRSEITRWGKVVALTGAKPE